MQSQIIYQLFTYNEDDKKNPYLPFKTKWRGRWRRRKQQQTEAFNLIIILVDGFTVLFFSFFVGCARKEINISNEGLCSNKAINKKGTRMKVMVLWQAINGSKGKIRTKAKVTDYCTSWPFMSYTFLVIIWLKK